MNALEFQHLATYGGSYTGVVVTGTQALATRGRVLEVFDVADPAAPRLLGTSPQLPVAAQVEAAGPGLAYLVERNHSAPELDNRYDQLHVVHVHDHGAPVLAGSLRLPRYALDDVLPVGHLLYGAGSKEGIVRIDVSDPAQPNLEQVLDLGMTVSGLAAYDGRLLAAATDADYGGWLYVLEPLAALHPNETARIRTGGKTGKVAVTGHYAFVESWQARPDGMNEGATMLVDLADPAAPRIVGRLPITDVRDFAVTADRVFALEAPHGVRDRYHLWSVETVHLPETATVHSDSRWGWGMAAAGDRVLLAAGPAGLLTLAHAVGADGVATIQEQNALPVLGAPQGVALADGHAYLTDADSELWVLDVQAPAVPVAVGRTRLEHSKPYALVDARGGPIVVRDGLAYVARQPFHFQPGGLHVFDVTDPAQPRQIGLWDPYTQAEIDPTYESWGGITGLRPPELVGSRIWLSGNPALTEIDASDPTDPRLVRHGDVPPDNVSYDGLDGGGITTDGSRLYVAAYEQGVFVTDLAAPGPIALVEHAEMPGYAADVALVGRHLLTVGYGTGLRVLDADTLGAVRSIEGLQAGGIEVVGDTAYVVATDGVHAYDVSDSAMPVLRGVLPTPLYPDLTQIAVEGDVLALTGVDAGLELVRLVDGQPIPEPTVGATLTPWPTRTPGTEPPRITPLPTSTFAPTTTPEIPATTAPLGSRVYLPVLMRDLDPDDELGPDEYEVLRAVIPYWVGGVDVAQLVIDDHTETWWIFDDPNALKARIAQTWPELGEVTAGQLLARNDRRYPLSDGLGLRWPFVLISEDTQTEIFRDGRGWDEFYERYPGAQGIMGLSRVGISPDGKWALAYLGNQCDWLAGRGNLYLLENTDDGWKVIDSMFLWIS